MTGLSIATPPRSEWFPIGSIYISVNTTNPGTIFGGTWERIKDKFMLCSGDTYSNGSTGGSATHLHGTTAIALTVAQLPSHTHQGKIGYNQSGYGYETRSWEAYLSSIASPIASTSGSNGELTNINTRSLAPTSATGSGATHSHGDTTSASTLPPYLAVTVWKRVA